MDDKLYLNFSWHRLDFEWRGADHRFDNYHQPKERWGAAAVQPVGKIWSASLKFARCEGFGDGPTPELALDAAFKEIEDAVAAARQQMTPGWYVQDAPVPNVLGIVECEMCTERAVRCYTGPGTNNRVYYCDHHAHERSAREAAKWTIL